MHRQPLISLLEDYRRRFPNETETSERFIAFVRAEPDCFERSLARGHITASAWLINRKSTHVLLTHHRKLGRWLQLGGHCDGDADVFRVARKEVAEESGIRRIEPSAPGIFDLDIHPIPARKNEPDHLHYDVRLGFFSEGLEAYTVSDESHDLRWVELGSVAELDRGESMLRMERKWLAGAR